MKVILLQDVKSLGKEGEVVNVSDGYGRNYIIPKNLGLEATSKNLNDLKMRKEKERKIEQEKLEAAKDFAKSMEGKEVIVKMKAGEGGKTFGSISTKEIAKKQLNSWEWNWTRRKFIFQNLLKALAFSKFL